MHCKAFEENSGAIELASIPKICFLMKHRIFFVHHFGEYVRKGIIHIIQVSTDYQGTNE